MRSSLKEALLTALASYPSAAVSSSASRGNDSSPRSAHASRHPSRRVISQPSATSQVEQVSPSLSPRVEWILKHSGQAVLIATRITWCHRVIECLKGQRVQRKKLLSDYHLEYVFYQDLFFPDISFLMTEFLPMKFYIEKNFLSCIVVGSNVMLRFAIFF